MRAARANKSQSGWAISLADLMGLLVSFFVMLTVLLTQDSDKFNDIATSMRKAFKSDGKNEIIVLIPPKPDAVDKKLEFKIKQILSKDPNFTKNFNQLEVRRENGKLIIELPLEQKQ
jgi:flagellar motor protein MotB